MSDSAFVKVTKVVSGTQEKMPQYSLGQRNPKESSFVSLKRLDSYAGRSTMFRKKFGAWLVIAALMLVANATIFGSLVFAGGGPSISVSKDNVTDIIDRASAKYGLAYGNGVTFRSNSATGFWFRPTVPTQGIGFHLATGGLVAGDVMENPTYINVGAFPNGTYHGSDTIHYYDDSSGISKPGPVVNYVILLVGSQLDALPCPSLRDAQGATGLPVEQLKTGEPCAFKIDGLPAGTTIRCPLAFVCTYDRSRELVVAQGPDSDAGTGMIMRWSSSLKVDYPDYEVFRLARAASQAPVFLRNQWVGYTPTADGGVVPFFK